MTNEFDDLIVNAIQACLAYAKDTRGTGVAEIAEHMGLPNKWVLFKWAETGHMPAKRIIAFEAACGCTYLSDALSGSGRKKANKRRSRHKRLLTFADANLLVARGLADAMAVERNEHKTRNAVLAITEAIEALLWLRAQVTTRGVAR